MNKIILKSLLLMIFSSVLYAQQKINPGIRNETVNYILPESKTPVEHSASPQNATLLENRLMAAKLSGNINEVMMIQDEIDRLTGSVSVELKPDPEVVLLRPSDPLNQTDNPVNIIRVLQRNNLKSLATATEQRGSTAGTIWVAVSVTGAVNDTLWVYSSSNNGFSWVGRGGFIFGGTYSYDELDMEIIENNTGDKYVWVVGGKQQAGVYNCFCGVISTGGPVGASFLTWPNTVSNVRFYRPRITSDNAFYTGNAWIYITACRDSIFSGGIKSQEWVARCDNPYAVLPTITYKPNEFGYTTLLTPSQTFRNYCDIAYYRNSNIDSIIVTESNLPDSTRIYLAKSGISSFTNSSLTFPIGSILGTAKWKTHARIASNGTSSNLMIVCDELYGGSDWDIPYFSSVNGGSLQWSTGYVDFTTFISLYPDITGRRNTAGKFYTAYGNTRTFNGFDSVNICTAVNNSWGTVVRPVNHILADMLTCPKPGIRYVNNDSCLTVWTEYVNHANVWASNGCTAPLISGINPNEGEIPMSYKLWQNYPNPFNPETKITLQIPKQGFVKLTVYDVLGNETALLVNRELEPGTYRADFDGTAFSSGVYFCRLEVNGYSEIKKMVLIK